jgi:hypothetical protein
MSKAGQITQLFWAAPPDHFIFIDADLNTHKPGYTAPGSVTPSWENKQSQQRPDAFDGLNFSNANISSDPETEVILDENPANE